MLGFITHYTPSSSILGDEKCQVIDLESFTNAKNHFYLTDLVKSDCVSYTRIDGTEMGNKAKAG